jgi:prepilin-type N-terminal cleavage/methylation domain-containing protein
MNRGAATTKGGFSLLEVLLVLALVAIFAAVAAPRYGRASGRHRADLAACVLSGPLICRTVRREHLSVTLRLMVVVVATMALGFAYAAIHVLQTGGGRQQTCRANEHVARSDSFAVRDCAGPKFILTERR